MLYKLAVALRDMDRLLDGAPDTETMKTGYGKLSQIKRELYTLLDDMEETTISKL